MIETSAAAVTDTTFVPAGALWKYLDKGTDQGTLWYARDFDDGSWAIGPAELGYGDGDEATVVDCGPSGSTCDRDYYITTYFRKTFDVIDAGEYANLALDIKREDGVVVYLNGAEVVRDNMPGGTITYSTHARSRAGRDGDVVHGFVIDASLLVAGQNVIAAEIHRARNGDPSISFDLELRGARPSLAVPTGLHAIGTTTDEVWLAWLASAGAVGYEIYRDGDLVGTSTTTGYVDRGLTAGTAHTYRIRAQGAAARYSELGAAITVSTASLPASRPGQVIVAYAMDTADRANPERGLYKHLETTTSRYSTLSASVLGDYRVRENVTLILRMIVFDSFVNSDLDSVVLDRLQADFDALRQAGVKAVLRLAYTKKTTPPYGDATRDRVLAHIAQMTPVLQANADVIAVVQAGFIGAFGEWFYTDHFANPDDPYDVSAQNYADRGEVLAALLDALPPTRMAQVRTPRYKTILYNTTAPVSAATAFDGSELSRTGHYNDCFLASSDDYGTYVDIAAEYPYLAADTTYTPMGGESCVPNPPRSECATALGELAMFHWSYLNVEYHSNVLASWEAGGCMPEVRSRLGYRLVLQWGQYGSQVQPGHGLEVVMQLGNQGFAAPFNPRLAELIMRNRHTGALHQVTLPDDPRSWLPGQAHVIQGTIDVPAAMPEGDYDLLLHLSDPETWLHGDPAYSIRLANHGLWEPATGYNQLGHIVSVSAGALPSARGGSLYFGPAGQDRTPESTNRFTLGRETADLRRIAALLLGRLERPNSLVAPCAACNCTISLGRANRSAP
jgi:hypothetical protein